MSTWIILPAYNAAKFVVAALDSICAQTVDDWHAVVVDDGSTDDTAALVAAAAARDPRISLVRQANGGIGVARNAGSRVALADPETSDLMFLDSDDVLLPDALSTLRAALAHDSSAVATIGLGMYVDRDGVDYEPGACQAWGRARRVPRGRLGIRTLALSEPTTFESLVCVHGVPTPGVVLYRRHVVEAVGGYDELLPTPCDWDFHVRVARRGHMAFVDTTVMGYRSHTENISKSPAMRTETLEVWQKIWASPENTDAQRASVVRGYRALQMFMVKAKGPNVLAYLRRGKVVLAAREVGYALNHVGRALRTHP